MPLEAVIGQVPGAAPLVTAAGPGADRMPAKPLTVAELQTAVAVVLAGGNDKPVNS